MEGHAPVSLVAVHPSGAQSATVIFLHGLGQSNLTWRIVVVEALARDLPHVLWLLPQAPLRPTLLNPYALRQAWFDVSSVPPSLHDFDEAGIAHSVNVVENLILDEVHRGVDPSRIILVGFSQGAALALMVGLTTLHELGGVASLSGWVPYGMRTSMIHALPHLPVFLAHGTEDEEVPPEYMDELYMFLTRTLQIPSGMVRARRYEGLGHRICDEELEDLSAWLQGILG